MSNCPHCKQNITVRELKRDTLGSGFFMQEIMNSYTDCDTILSVSRGKYR
jgi:hypothetical protein